MAKGLWQLGKPVCGAGVGRKWKAPKGDRTEVRGSIILKMKGLKPQARSSARCGRQT